MHYLRCQCRIVLGVLDKNWHVVANRGLFSLFAVVQQQFFITCVDHRDLQLQKERRVKVAHISKSWELFNVCERYKIAWVSTTKFATIVHVCATKVKIIIANINKSYFAKGYHTLSSCRPFSRFVFFEAHWICCEMWDCFIVTSIFFPLLMSPCQQLVCVCAVLYKYGILLLLCVVKCA